MIQFVKTLIAGIKEGAIAAWYDLKWYICIMAIILVVYLAFSAIKKICTHVGKIIKGKASGQD